jgi:hypothetical protein
MAEKSKTRQVEIDGGRDEDFTLSHAFTKPLWKATAA